MRSKPKGLFLNPAKANCSIHESGRMVYECLALSERFSLDYQELSETARQMPGGYDFYAFNYHHATMGWLDPRGVRQLPGLKLTFVLETLRNNPFVLCPADAFDVYCALDPTMQSIDKRVYAFPRPLEAAPPLAPFQEAEIPWIGSFGFATKGKGFELVVDAVNREFERAKVRINIPPGTYADPEYVNYLTQLCLDTAKPGIEVVITRDYMDKAQLIEWCAQNTLNCFLYNRNMPGLSATTDQAISSGRPLAISTNETFRHIHPFVKPYPLRSLRESIALSVPEVAQMQEAWQPQHFATRFEEVLADFPALQALNKSDASPITLPLLQPASRFQRRVLPIVRKIAVNLAPPILSKAARRLRQSDPKANLVPPQMIPAVHPVLGSHSQFNEDLLLDLLLLKRESGFYVDVGANDPTFNNNTRRFYDRGWSGINIEPGITAYRALCEARPRDINLNCGVGKSSETLTFYEIEGDPTLSSFDSEAAHGMATLFGLSVTPKPVPVQMLRDIFTEHAATQTIDFLSVDAEGVDLDVLQSNDWNQFRPALVLVEMNNQSAEILTYLSEQSYLLLLNNQYNGLFLDLRTSDVELKTLLEQHYS